MGGILVAIASALLCHAAASAVPSLREADARSVLLHDVGLTAKELAALDRGDSVARVLEKRDRHDLAILGAVRIAVPPEFFLARAGDITSFKKGKIVLQIGRFSGPPRLDDLRALVFERSDLDALEDCRVGACDLRLPAIDILNLRTTLSGTHQTRRSTADAWLRERMLAYVRAYRSEGNRALVTYADQKRPVALADETATLLTYSSSLLARAPEFQDYLARFPDTPLGVTHDFLYWSKEAFGMKPVVSVTHVTVYTPGADVRRSVSLMASKQIYASHYFDASLSLSVVAPTCAGDRCSIYLAYVNRSRTALPGGPFGGLARSIVQRRTSDGMKTTLAETRDRLESEFRHEISAGNFSGG